MKSRDLFRPFGSGIGVGIAIGVSIGVASENPGAGIGIGIAIGVALGVVFERRQRKSASDDAGDDGEE